MHSEVQAALAAATAGLTAAATASSQREMDSQRREIEARREAREEMEAVRAKGANEVRRSRWTSYPLPPTSYPYLLPATSIT